MTVVGGEAVVVGTEGFEQRTHIAACTRNNAVRAQIGERSEDEPPLGHLSVRNYQLRAFELSVAEKDDVEVDHAGSPNHGFFSAQLAFDGLQGLEKCPG